MKTKRIKQSRKAMLEPDRGDKSLLASASTRPAASLFRLKKILVPVDFSECSKKALQYAMPLARQHQAALTLLYVVQPPSFVAGEFAGLDYSRLEDNQSTGELQRLADLVAAEVRGKVPAETLVRTGMPVVEILEAAKVLPADLIVISTHGRTGLKHALLGSVAEDVVRRAPCPVLVVREHEHDFVGG